MPDFNLGRHTVCFVRNSNQRGQLIGSGTLFRWGRLPGILTAAHVLDEVLNNEEVGFLEFPTRQSEPQRIRAKVGHFDFVRLGNAPYNELGPDLAFIRLPLLTASAIQARSSFVNFEKQRVASFIGSPPGTRKIVDAVTGGIEEWKRDQLHIGSMDVTVLVGLLNDGKSRKLKSHEGLDRFRFVPSSIVERPNSYAGTSGGGLWRSYRRPLGNEQYQQIELRMRGVAFFQTKPSPNVGRSIICHGPQAVFKDLADLIRGKWGDDIAE